MKISFALGLAVSCGTFALMGAPNTAHAVNALHSGVICKNYNAAEVMDIDYFTVGTRNLATTPRSIICPLVVAPAPANGGHRTVKVDGFAATGFSIFCTLYTYNNKGKLRGSQGFTSAQTGVFEVTLTTPAGGLGTSSVLCTLPASNTSYLSEIQVVQ
jgi:hypothetical protein